MKAKKILSALLAFAMIFSMLNISVFAEETAATVVAKINDTGYTTLAEAVTAANAGDTITLLQSIDSIPNINKAITIKGENTGIAVNALIAENFPNINGTVAFENLVFNQRISTENASSDQSNLTLKFVGCTFNVPAENTYAIQAGASWNNDVLGELYIENCTFTTNATSFVKGYMVYAQCVEKVTIKDSGFNGNSAYRGAIHLGDSTVYATTAVIEGNTITNTARGVQVGNRVEGSSLTINNNTFSNVNAISGETESGSVYIHEVANAATTDVTYTNNKITESNDATPVIFSENATGAVSDFVSSFNGNTVNSIAVSTEDTGVYNDTAYVAPTPVEVTTYAELVEALAAGGEIKLTADITTSEALVTSGVTATIDLNGKTLNVRAGDNKFNDASNITIKNGTINIDGVVVENGNAIFCLDEYEETLETTVTLNNVNVEGTDYSSAYGIFYIGASSMLNVNGGTWTLSNDKFSAGGVFKANSPDATLNISGAAMDLHNVRRVVTYADTTIENSTLTIYGDADGVDAEMEHGFNRSPLAVVNSTITMTDMVGRGITAEFGAVSISEGSTVTIENVQEATIDVRAGQTVTVSADSTVSVDKEPTITSGTISGNVTKVEKVAEVNGVSYLTLAEALAAAKDGDTITLIWAEGDAPIAMNGYVSGKTVTITGTAQVDWEKGFLFVGRTNDGTTAGDATLIFKDANLTTTQGGDHGIHVSGTEKDSATKADGTVEIINSTINLSYLINKGAMTLENSTLTVKSGFSIGGRPASESESGEDATATLTLNNNSKVIVNNHNGMGLGYEAIGVMDVNSGSTFECTQDFLITAKGTMNINGGNLIVDGKLTTYKNLFISGASVIKIKNLEGRATVMDDTTLTGSYIKSTANGTTRILGDLTLNGGFDAAYLMTAGSTTATTGYEGTITIEDDTTVNVSYGVEMNGNVTLNGGTIDLSGGNASGAIWGCVFQSGTFEINSDIVVNGGSDTAPIHFTNATATINGSITQSKTGGEPIYVGESSTVTIGNDAVITTDCSVNVTGTLKSSGDVYGTITKATDAAVIEISGGTYTQDVSEFCADGYTCVQNEDGTYGVQEKSEESTALNTKVFFLYNRTPMEAPAAIQEKYGEGNYYRVRLYAAIDGLDYSELGFKVAIDNGVNTPASAVFALENKVVYDTIKVTTVDGTTTLKPEQFNHTEDFNAKYLYALNVWVHGDWGPETKLSVTPYAKDLNLKEFNGLVWGSDIIGTVQE